MKGVFHLLTGEYPPQVGGVGDYTRIVARGLASRGWTVHVWCPSAGTEADAGVHVHALPDRFGPGARRALESAFAREPGPVVLEYVPNALGARGANLPFCIWLLRMRRRGIDVRVMFHEPYFYFSWERPWRNGLAAAQRLMAALLLRASPSAYISTSAWRRYLTPWGARHLIESPIPATVPASAERDDVQRWRERFLVGAPGGLLCGHFGTFGEHVAGELLEIVPALLAAVPSARFVFIGRGSDAFAARLARQHPPLAPRLAAAGPVAAADVGAALQACDLAVQPFPDGVTTRRTSIMAALANGVAAVTTDGALTEPVWRESGAVQLAARHDIAAAAARLLADAAARRALGASGRAVYEARFALGHTLDRLAGAGAAAA